MSTSISKIKIKKTVCISLFKSFFFLLSLQLLSIGTVAKVINPVDQEDFGQLVVTDQALGAYEGLLRVTLGKETKKESLQLGKSRRIPAGTYCVGLIHEMRNSKYETEDCSILVEVGKLTTINLGSLATTYAPQFPVDIGPPATFLLNSWDLEKEKMPKMVVLPKTYVARYSGGGSFKFEITVNPGEHIVFSPKIPDLRKTYSFEVTPPTFADARRVVCGHPSTAYFIYRRPDTIPNQAITPITSEPLAHDVASQQDGVNNAIGLDSYHRRIEAFIPVTNKLKVRAFKSLDYEFLVNGLKGTFTSDENGIIKSNLQRIEVDDVKVFREDGSFYMASGQYSVLNTKSSWNFAPEGCPFDQYGFTQFPTRTSIDLPPGEYQIFLEYSTEEGEKMKTINVKLED